MTSTSGTKVVIFVKKNTTISELLKKYMDKISLPFKHIEEGNIVILFNADELNPFSNEPISSRVMDKSVRMTVLDVNNIIMNDNIK